MKRPIRTTLLLIAVLAAGVISAVQFTPTASAASAQQVRLVTFNVDFRGVPYVKRAMGVIAPHADIVFFQEAKYLDLRNALNTDTWIVRQSLKSKDRQGAAVAVRRSIVKQAGSLGLFIGTRGGHCDGGGIDDRYIANVPVQLKNGRWIRAASVHLPPKRCQTGPGSLYATMANSIVKFGNRSSRLTVIGGDWNKIVDHDPNNIGQRTGLLPRGPNNNWRIDGFYVSRQLSPCCLVKMRKIYAGDPNVHQPVQLTIKVPAP